MLGFWLVWLGTGAFRSWPLSCASSSNTDRAREDILAKEASISTLLSLEGDPSQSVVSEPVSDMAVKDKFGGTSAGISG